MTKWYDRVLLVIVLLVVLCFAGLLVTFVSPGVADTASRVLVSLVSVQQNRFIFCAVGVVLAVLCIRLFVALSGPKVPSGPDAVLISSGSDGSSQIAISALEAMILRSASKNASVREVHTRLTVNERNEITVYLRILPAPDVVLPQVTQELQSGVKEYIQQYAGIPVNEVVVLIDAAPKTNVQPPRVE